MKKKSWIEELEWCDKCKCYKDSAIATSGSNTASSSERRECECGLLHCWKCQLTVKEGHECMFDKFKV